MARVGAVSGGGGTEGLSEAEVQALISDAVGVTVQAHDSELDTLAALTSTAAGRAVLTAATNAAIRTLLSLVPGTDVQAFHANLAALAGLTGGSDKGIRFTGSGAMATFDQTAAGRALLDDADASAQLTTLGVSAYAKTLLDDADALTARGTLGADVRLAAVPAYDATGGTIKAWTCDSATASGTQALTPGRLYLGLMPVPADRLITNLSFYQVSAATTPTTSQCFVGVMDRAGTRLAMSADISADLATGANVLKTYAMSSPLTVAAGVGEYVFAALIFNGTTGPTVSRAVDIAPAHNFSNSVTPTIGTSRAVYQASLTTIPSAITPASLVKGQLLWMAAS